MIHVMFNERYAAPILVDVEYTVGSRDKAAKVTKVFGYYCNLNLTTRLYIIFNLVLFSQNDVTIGQMPIMLRSCCCVLYGRDEAELAKLGSNGLENITYTLLCIFFFLIFFPPQFFYKFLPGFD